MIAALLAVGLSVVSPGEEADRQVKAAEPIAILALREPQCAAEFKELNPGFNPVKRLKNLTVVRLEALEMLALAGRPGVMAASSCDWPQKVGIWRTGAAMAEVRKIAKVLVHELAHLAQCGRRPAGEANEALAQAVAAVCVP